MGGHLDRIQMMRIRDCNVSSICNPKIPGVLLFAVKLATIGAGKCYWSLMVRLMSICERFGLKICVACIRRMKGLP